MINEELENQSLWQRLNCFNTIMLVKAIFEPNSKPVHGLDYVEIETSLELI